ncbi:MAG: HAMP domain-containing histidine kinase [Proteobacteria bacterium]|nr:HAMP domain-containing histidine kinase [Pseudomonadota bacterium]
MSDSVDPLASFDAPAACPSPSEARLRAILERAPVSIVEEDWTVTRDLLAGLRARGVVDGPAYFAAHPSFVRACLQGVRVVSRNAQARAWDDARMAQPGDDSLAAVFDSPQSLAWFIDELDAIWAGHAVYTARRTQRGPDGRPATLQVTVALPDLSPGGDATALVSVTDVTELKRINSELGASADHLARANQELESFTYSVSHDLKAPLRGVEAYSRLLLQSHGTALNDEGRQFLGHIRKGTLQMGALIDDLMAYSCAERAPMALAPLALGPLIEAVVGEVRDAYPQQSLHVELDVPASSQARGDASALTMALRNVLDNAVKFTPRDRPPVIQVSTQVQQGQVAIAVRDHGVGFQMKHHDRIFEIFQRLHPAEDYPGTGVGLAIVRKAMERMGGTVQAHSSAGHGATFTLYLPAAQA